MKICLVVHGFPNDLRGGTERTVESLALELRSAGHEVFVIAGTDQWEKGFRVSEIVEPSGVRVLRIHRVDPHYAHWHKFHSNAVGEAFEQLLARERPDVLHVHHWLRLTSDLARRAARIGIPSVVTLHDLSRTCLVTHRVLPTTLETCTVPLRADPCLRCARGLHLPTPWVSDDAAAARLDEWKEDTRAELSAARVLTVLSNDHARRLTELLPWDGPFEITPPVLLPHLLPKRRAPKPIPDPSSPLTLGSWGTFGSLKGQDILVQAIRLARDAGAQVGLRLAGQVSQPEYLARVRRDARGLDITIDGPFKSLDGHPVTDVDAFVSGTRAQETWGLVADEALAIGLPLILPRSGAFVERFEPGGALFYGAGDAESLAELLCALDRDRSPLARLEPSQPRTTQARTTVGSGERHVRLYEEALQAPQPTLSVASYEREQDWMERWNSGFEAAHSGGGA